MKIKIKGGEAMILPPEVVMKKLNSDHSLFGILSKTSIDWSLIDKKIETIDEYYEYILNKIKTENEKIKKIEYIKHMLVIGLLDGKKKTKIRNHKYMSQQYVINYLSETEIGKTFKI